MSFIVSFSKNSALSLLSLKVEVILPKKYLSSLILIASHYWLWWRCSPTLPCLLRFVSRQTRVRYRNTSISAKWHSKFSCSAYNRSKMLKFFCTNDGNAKGRRARSKSSTALNCLCPSPHLLWPISIICIWIYIFSARMLLRFCVANR